MSWKSLIFSTFNSYLLSTSFPPALTYCWRDSQTDLIAALLLSSFYLPANRLLDSTDLSLFIPGPLHIPLSLQRQTKLRRINSPLSPEKSLLCLCSVRRGSDTATMCHPTFISCPPGERWGYSVYCMLSQYWIPQGNSSKGSLVTNRLCGHMQNWTFTVPIVTALVLIWY